MKRVRGSEQRLFSVTTFSVMLSVVRSFMTGTSLGMGAHRAAAAAAASGVDML